MSCDASCRSALDSLGFIWEVSGNLKFLRQRQAALGEAAVPDKTAFRVRT
jgi:hypothetical protein